MRIGIDCRLWNESGVGRYTRNLVSELVKIDKQNDYILFVLTRDVSSIKYYVSSKNTKVIVANIRWHTVTEQLQFPAIINQQNIDLVHFPYFSVPIFYNRPFVVTIHDLILHHFPTGEASTLPLPIYQLKLLGYKFVISQAAKKARKIITVSKATKKEIVDHLGVNQDKVVVTYESVDDRLNSKLPASPRSTAGLRGASKIENYFLYVGNAYPHKNLERLLQAFKRVIQRAEVALAGPASHSSKGARSSLSFGTERTARLWTPPLASPAAGSPRSLVLVGKEDYFYKRLKEKVKEMGLLGSVIFYGEASDEELISLYQNAKALIMPSLMEGFGLPALEAMANKCLVLASNIPALKEICGDAAVYFNPYDVSDIVEKMRTVHSNDTYHYSGNIEKGFKRAKMFSWKKMARETLKIYESSFGL